MPLVTKVPAVTPKPPEPVLTEADKFKGRTVDSRHVSESDVIAYIEGSDWSVNYFSSILGSDDGAAGQSESTSAAIKQYRLVEKMILRVTSDLTQSQDSDTKVMTVTGTANMYPGVIPNEGDMFTADIGDGREAIFKITNTDRKSFYKEATYTVEYVLVDFSTEERIKDLYSKVINHYVFVKDRMIYNQTPIVQEKEFTQLKDLSVLYEKMARTYFKYFFSREFQTLVIPDQDSFIYDHFLTKTMMGLCQPKEAPEIASIRIMNIDDDYLMRTNTLWDALLNVDYTILNYAAFKYGLVSAKAFGAHPMFQNIKFSGLDYVTYPVDPVKDLDAIKFYHEKLLSPKLIKNVPGRTNLPPSTPRPIAGTDEFNFDMVPPYRDALDGTIDGQFDFNMVPHYRDALDGTIDGVAQDNSPVTGTNNIDPDLVDILDDILTEDTGDGLDVSDYDDIINGIDESVLEAPDIHLVTVDNYYILSEAFYKFNNGLQGPGMSKLEVMVCRMLRKMPLDVKELIRLSESYHHWGSVERFYYVPILMMMIKYQLRK